MLIYSHMLYWHLSMIELDVYVCSFSIPVVQYRMVYGTGLFLGVLMMGSDNSPIRPRDGANACFLTLQQWSEMAKMTQDELLTLEMILFEPTMQLIDHSVNDENFISIAFSKIESFSENWIIERSEWTFWIFPGLQIQEWPVSANKNIDHSVTKITCFEKALPSILRLSFLKITDTSKNRIHICHRPLLPSVFLFRPIF